MTAENMPQFVAHNTEQLFIGQMQNCIALDDDERIVRSQGGRVQERTLSNKRIRLCRAIEDRTGLVQGVVDTSELRARHFYR